MDLLHLNSFHFRPAILVYRSVSTCLEDVTIHAQPGMGIVGFDSKDIFIKRLSIRPSSGYYQSTNTDATHFACCEGVLHFQGCYFQGQGDDATNVHGYYQTIIRAEGNSADLEVKAGTYTHAQVADVPRVGDEMELVEIRTLKPVWTYKVKEVKHFVDDGAAWIILRTTEHYGEERLRVLMRQVSTMLPEGCILVANTSQLSLDALTSLKETGVQGIYHALRLGEGRDTPFVAEKRRKALARIPRAGLVLAHLVEPLGIEHSNEEIAACFMAAQAAGAGVCGVMARNNVPGTPFEKSPTLPDKRLAQVAAVTRLCGGLKMPWICVHPPVPQALAWGANVVVVETGAVPRDSEEAHTEWKNFTIADARKLLAAQGYSVHKTVY